MTENINLGSRSDLPGVDEHLSPLPDNDQDLISDPSPDDRGGDASRRISRGRLILRRFLRNRLAVAGLIIIAILAFAAFIGPYFLRWNYTDIDDNAFLQPPSAIHLLGTTQAGQDVLALTLRGMSKSLLVGFCVSIISVTIAATVGSFAAYLGGWFQRIALWVIDLLLVIPSFLLIAIFMSPQGGTLRRALGLNAGNAWIMLVFLLAAFGWMLSARVVRSISMSVKENEYVHAARFMGLPAPVVIFRHILPNISSLLIIDAALNVGYAILSETFLAFFGFGIQPPDTSLGTLISMGQRMATTFPWIFIAPSVVLVVLVMSVNAVGDGLRDALDPNSQAGGSAR